MFRKSLIGNFLFRPLVFIVIVSGVISCANLATVEVNKEAYEQFLNTLNYTRGYHLVRSAGDLPYLRQSLKDPSPLVRFNSAQDLLVIASDAAPLRPEIEQCSRDRVARVAKMCRKILLAIGPAESSADAQSPTAAEPIEIVTLAKAETNTSIALDSDLTTTKPPASSAAKKKENELSTVKPSNIEMARVYRVAELALRSYARQTLPMRDPQQLGTWLKEIPYLKKKLSSGSAREKQAAVEVLRNLSNYLDEAIPPLVDALKIPLPEVCSKAALALGEAREEQAVPSLAAMLPGNCGVPQAGVALQLIGTEAAIRAVEPYITNGRVIRAATDVISLRGRPPANARDLHRICYRLLSQRDVTGPSLNYETKLCVQESGAYY